MRRIIALLLAMADLAQAACGRSAPVRWVALLILGSAEAVAQVYVARLTGVQTVTLSTPIVIGSDAGIVDDSIARAMRLIFVFRALAAMLAALPEDAAAPTLRLARVPAALCDLMAAALPVELSDTS